MTQPAVSAATSAPAPSSGRYEVREQIAAGGMGVVYRAIDRASGEPRALKRLVQPDGAHAAELRAAFEREYQVLAGLDHPRIIRVFDYGVDTHGPFYVMELLDGLDVRALAPIPWQTACRALRDVATSLALLHARRLLHRDLSPTNVRIGADGRAKLLDFGALADFGRCQHVVGTAPLIAPEVLRGAALDQRTDLYALGALAYYAISGRHAFPARGVRQLPEAWQTPPPALSELCAEVPVLLSELVAELLGAEPDARPDSAADVIVRLDGLLGPSEASERDDALLAASYLQNPRFIGRSEVEAALLGSVRGAVEGHGRAIGVRGTRGTGRTRVLDEGAMVARQAGAVVVRVDASTQRTGLAVTRALVIQLCDALPDALRRHVGPHAPALSALGPEVAARVRAVAERRAPSASEPRREDTAGVAGFVCALAREQPLVVQVDNTESADDASLGLLAELARRSSDAPLALQWTASDTAGEGGLGLSTLGSYSSALTLGPFSRAETLVFARTVFGHAPKVDRFAEWMHDLTAGNPLFCVELMRSLHAEGAIRHRRGSWDLPAARPAMALPAGLEDMLRKGLLGLSAPARGLAERLSLVRGALHLALCEALFDGDVQGVLNELMSAGVLAVQWGGGVAFRSAAVRSVLAESLDETDAERHHLRIGHALERLAGGRDLLLAIEAGHHHIAGGNYEHGADLTAAQFTRADDVRTLLADLHHLGASAEAALVIYKRLRRSVYARLPLVSALAQAGYYEDLRWAQRYGDDALDALDQVTGLGRARRLVPYLGRLLALMVGMGLGFAAFLLTPKRERAYSYYGLLTHLFTVVSTMCGVGALSLDQQRARRVAAMFAPFMALPRFATVRAMAEYCEALAHVPDEPSIRALDRVEALADRIADPRCYRLLPEDSRRLLRAGLAFALGARFAMMADGTRALAQAEILDRSGLKLYAMIASQLRYLYHYNRGELILAENQRAQVELHAAHVGSAWQVETWQPAALIPVAVELEDGVAISRSHQQLSVLARSLPSLVVYRRLAAAAALVIRLSRAEESRELRTALAGYGPRAFLGWSTAVGGLAQAMNGEGRYAEARELLESALSGLPDEDRQFVALYLCLDVERATADAGLGEVDAALARLDERIAALTPTGHPLALGVLHETRARIAFDAGRRALFESSRRIAIGWFRLTRTPQLLARCESLLSLDRSEHAGSLSALTARSSAANDGQGATEAEAIASVTVRT